MAGRYSEDELIAKIFAPIAGAAALGLRDDAALLPAGPEPLALTADMLVAGVHFFPDDAPGMIARKALRVNVSDLAAKGADPLGFLLTFAIDETVTADWIAGFAAALGADAGQYACPLLGGDTVRTPGPLTFSVTALGATPHGRMVARTGARAGDYLYVSGFIGDAALGLHARLGDRPWVGRVTETSRAYLIDRYLHPQPRLALAHALRDHASGAMDVSDGLAGDLAKMMRASGAGARVDIARVPLSDAVRAAARMEPALLETALTGGDDYEILASVPPERAGAFEHAARVAGVHMARIGVVTEADTGAIFLDANGAPRTFARGSYSHF